MNEQIKQGSTIESSDGQQIMGFVASTDGATVVVVSADGTLRELKPGDAIHEGDILQVTDGSHVTIAFADGSTRQLDAGGSFVVSQDNLDQLALADSGEEENPEFEALLAALNAGEDISQGQEATAAGEAGGSGGGDEIGQGLYFGLVGGEVTPTAGIDPDYVPPALLDPTADTDVQEGVPTVSVSVAVEIEIQNPPDGGEPPTTPNEDYPVIVNGNAASVWEGTSEGGKEIVFILQLDKAYNQDVTITYELQPGTADNPEDWFDGPLINTVTIPAGETTFPVTVTIVEDHFDEGNETFDIVILSATNATVNPSSNSATVTIFDDDTTPVANDDENSVQEDVQTSTDGNVITATSSGDVADTDADGDTLVVVAVDGSDANVGNTIDGTYGTLTLNSDGSYTYELNNDLDAVQGLSEGETLEESFAYTISDTYNAEQNATLTIIINGADDGVTISGLTVEGADHSLDEDDLPAGSDDTKESLTADGSFDIDAKDGLDTIEIGGESFTLAELNNLAGSPVSIVTAAGTLTLLGYSGDEYGGTISYSYELQNATAHTLAGEDAKYDQFNVVVTDEDGSTDSAVLNIEIVDDVAMAAADVNTATEGGTTSETDLTGVLSNDTLGADDARVTGVVKGDSGGSDVTGNVASQIEGDYGRLTLNADGSYTYDAKSSVNEGSVDVFTYTITDRDGDTSTTTLTITFEGDNNLPRAQNDSASIDEQYLPGGSDPGADSDTVSGSVTFDYGTDGAGSIALDFTSGTYGTMSMDGSGNWTYTLSGPITDAAGDETDTFTYTVTDSDGSTVQKSIVITIIDDVPTAAADVNTATEGGTTSETDLTGVLSNDTLGADDASVTGVASGDSGGSDVAGNVASEINGTYGKLTLNGDGSYSYVANASVDAGSVDVFTYTITDGDGDTSTATLTITFEGDNNLPTAEDDSASIDEQYLPGGSDPGADSDTVSGSVTFDYGTDGAGSIALDFTSGTYGTMSMDGSGNWTYTLSGPITDAAGDETDTFTYTVTDSDGSTVQKSIVITIIDDVPSIDPVNAILDNSTPNTLTGSLNLISGADGTASLTLTPQTSGGFIQVTVDGSLEFMTSQGHKLIAVDDGAGGFSAVADLDDDGTVSAGDTTVFAVSLNGDGTYTVDLIGELDGSDKDTTFSLSDGIKGGNNLDFYLFEPGLAYDDQSIDPNQGDSTDIFGPGAGEENFTVIKASGYDNSDNPLTVNSSDFSLGVGSGQDINGTKTLLLEFTQADTWQLQDDGGSPSNDGIYDATGDTDKTYVSLSSLTLGLRAFSVGETALITLYKDDGSGDPTEDAEILGVIQVTNNTGTDYTSTSLFFTIGQDGVVDAPDGLDATVISGSLQSLFDGSADWSFDSVALTADATSDYKVSSITTTETTTGFEQSLEVTAVAEDGDGDLAGDTFQIVFDGTGTIVGTTGDDVLAGGSGNDTMTGDSGADIFQWNLGDEDADSVNAGIQPSTDTITDFNMGEGDVLDLSSLLGDVAEVGTTLDDYLNISVSNGDTIVKVDVSGGGDFTTPDQTIVLDGTDITGGVGDQATLIDNLVASGNLNTDGIS